MQVDIRKVVSVGGNSYGVILPRKWVRYYKIEDSKVRVIEKDNKIIIRPLEEDKIE